MSAVELQSKIREGMNAIENGNTLMALLHFEDAAKIGQTPTVSSCLGYCLAKERRQMQKAASLCLEAMQAEPHNSLHYLNLGRIYLLAGQKLRAIQVFRRGLKAERNTAIMEELRSLGFRRDLVLPSLSRNHPLNKLFGKFFSRLGMR